ncbi:methyltransferase domain-containing protein [Nakamurella antarctica]|uniref:Methyltransferase domain-containing protein n=1 Tax=Nakamurella antarctica TaxID=1902245 RepID=A0A3G8ZVM9_9ACTN|nr:methyltransferase domain-containing protein [Nakamurella antarctica]AZI58524.1 methyltransferase domain-containing protein [Nakamurella antarctica]
MISKYDISVDLGNEGTSHRFMVELVGSNKSVLDVGCATGYLAQTLNAFGNWVSGVEYDPEAAETARAHMKRVVVADLDNADLAVAMDGEKFDVVVFGDVLEHLRDPLPTLRQARQLLNPDGYIVISIPNVSHGDVRMSLLLGRFQYRNLGLLDTTHLRFFTRDTLQELLTDAGFIATEVRTTKAGLFTTELGVREDEIDPSVIEAIAKDHDATTYQFVLTAVPEGAAGLAQRAAWRLQESENHIAGLHENVNQIAAELTATASALADAEHRVAACEGERKALSSQVDTLWTQLNSTQMELSRVHSERASAADLAPPADGPATQDLAAELAAATKELEAVRATKTFRLHHLVTDIILPRRRR